MEVTLDKVKEVIADQLGLEADEIKPDALLVDDLGAGSFDLVDLIVALEEQYNVKVEAVDFEGIKTVQDVYNYVQKLLQNG
jgi:acyl carrier protein